MSLAAAPALSNDTTFGPENPFFHPSTLPFHTAPFDRIKDSDYQPAIEAGMAQQLAEVDAIALNPAAPTFDNTLVALERSGQLFHRAFAAFSALTAANTNPLLQHVEQVEAPKLAAHRDAIFLNAPLFRRVQTLYHQRASLHLDPESSRLLDICHQRFLHAGANLSDPEKTRLKQLNEEESTLSNAFRTRVLAATQAAAFTSSDPSALAGLTSAQLTAAGHAAAARSLPGYLLPLQNTTQQPALAQLTSRATRQALFHASLQRAEQADANDTRALVARLAQLRAEKAQLLGFPTYAAWKLSDQMAETPAAALAFMDALVPPATARARAEAAEIQATIDAQQDPFRLQPWDWDFYAEQVRRTRYHLDESQVRPYFELNRVLEDGVFFASTQLYGITFHERFDIPVYHPDVRVFEVLDHDGTSLALFYGDFFKRDNKRGGAWMSNLVDQSTLLRTLPVILNVANVPRPAPGEPALISFDDVITLFHEFGHALHGIFSNVRFPTLSGTSVPRDFVEFPSQFNQHWALHPVVFSHYAKHCETGAPMPGPLAAKLRESQAFNQGYALTELLAAAQLDMQWHTLAPGLPLQQPDAFEQAALERTRLALPQVPPRYRSTFFSHIWGGGYAAGYYAYLWSEMLDHHAFQIVEDQGGLTRANGNRLRSMVLSRGNAEELNAMYAAWAGSPPTSAPMLKYRDLTPETK